MAKEVTREQAERRKAQTVRFMARIGELDRAREFSDMTVDEYAEHRGLRLANPNEMRKRNMANTNSKAELQDEIDRAIDTLDGAYTPETSREELAAAVGEALSILRGEDVEIGEDEEDEDEDSREYGNLEDR